MSINVLKLFIEYSLNSVKKLFAIISTTPENRIIDKFLSESIDLADLEWRLKYVSRRSSNQIICSNVPYNCNISYRGNIL